MQSCELFSRNSWNDNSDGIYDQQSCWRFDTDGIGSGFFSIHGSILEGGTEIISTGTQSDEGSDSHRINAVIAQNYLMGSHITQRHIAVEKAGATVRNNVMTYPDTPHYAVWGPLKFFKVTWDGVVAGEGDAPVRIYNNTLINLSDVPVVEIDDDDTFTDAIYANNLFYQDNAAPNQTSDGPLDQTALFVPTELGYKHNATYADGLDVLQTAYATPAADVWTGGLLTTAGAIGAYTTGPIAYDDFNGDVRDTVLASLTRSVESIGAHEPNLES